MSLKKGWLIDGFENRFGNFQTFVLNLGRFLKIFGKSKKKRVEFLKIQGVFSKIPGRAKKKQTDFEKKAG